MLPEEEEQTNGISIPFKGLDCLLYFVEKLLNDPVDSPTNNKFLSILNVQSQPNFKIAQYIHRINDVIKLTDEEFYMILIFIDKLAEIHRIQLNQQNVFKILLPLMLLIHKFNNDDLLCNNKDFAYLGGIKLEEMNDLEGLMLQLLQYNLYVNDDYLNMYKIETYEFIKNNNPTI